MSEGYVIGVDHGYAAMKTVHGSFPSGLVAYHCKHSSGWLGCHVPPKSGEYPRQLHSGTHLSASGEVVAIGEFGSADRFAYWSSSISKTLLV